MADLLIPIHEYIGESSYNWETDTYERATNCEDLRWAVQCREWSGEAFDRVVLEVGNCYGGSVYEGLAMFHYLQGLNVPILTRIMGTVASMGTVLPLAGDDIECAQTSQWMIHAPSNEFWGTSAEIKAGLKGLDGDTQALADLYAARTGADAATVAQWMSQDTWMTAAEALAAGLCTSVLPLRPKTAPAAPVLNEAQARARRTRFAEAVARADKRTPSIANLPTTASAPISAPMAKPTTAPKPTPRAAAPAAPKSPQARKTVVQQILEALGITGEAPTESAAEAEAADVQSTQLDNDAYLYHDGALAQGSLVFNDEALTEATADGDYDTADAQVISVAAGAVTAIAAATEAAAPAATPAAATATLAQRLDALEAKLKTVEGSNASLTAENERLKKLKPAMPTARKPTASGSEAPDPKAARVANVNPADHGTL